MRADDWLVFVGIIETDGIVQVGDIDCGNVVSEREGEVSEFAVVRDIGVDGDGILSLFAEGDEFLGDTLFAGRIVAEWVDNPDCARISFVGYVMYGMG